MKTMTRNVETKRRRSNENGATVVEFAVIVFLLLLIIFGILEFAFIFYQRHFIENAAREGVRIGIRADNYETFDDAPGPGCIDKLNCYCAVDEAVRDYLSTLYQDIYKAADAVAVERVDEDGEPSVAIVESDVGRGDVEASEAAGERLTQEP